MATRFVEFEHTRLALHIAGRGPFAVLLHGFPLDHRMWLELMHGPLAAARTFVAVDLRGHGESPWCGDAVHTMAAFAEDVAAVVHTISDEPVDVVGLSMGGYVAQALWAEHRELVRSLVLADTRSRDDDAAARAGREAAMRTVVEQGRPALAAAMLGKLLAPRADDDPHALLLRARLQTMICAMPVESIVADLRGLRDRPDRTPLLPGITVPVLAIGGEHDAISPPAEMRALAAAIPGARHAVVPDAGHMAPIEAPAAFARELGEFWRTTGP